MALGLSTPTKKTIVRILLDLDGTHKLYRLPAAEGAPPEPYERQNEHVLKVIEKITHTLKAIEAETGQEVTLEVHIFTARSPTVSILHTLLSAEVASKVNPDKPIEQHYQESLSLVTNVVEDTKKRKLPLSSDYPVIHVFDVVRGLGGTYCEYPSFERLLAAELVKLGKVLNRLSRTDEVKGTALSPIQIINECFWELRSVRKAAMRAVAKEYTRDAFIEKSWEVIANISEGSASAWMKNPAIAIFFTASVLEIELAKECKSSSAKHPVLKKIITTDLSKEVDEVVYVWIDDSGVNARGEGLFVDAIQDFDKNPIKGFNPQEHIAYLQCNRYDGTLSFYPEAPTAGSEIFKSIIAAIQASISKPLPKAIVSKITVELETKEMPVIKRTKPEAKVGSSLPWLGTNRGHTRKTALPHAEIGTKGPISVGEHRSLKRIPRVMAGLGTLPPLEEKVEKKDLEAPKKPDSAWQRIWKGFHGLSLKSPGIREY